MNRLLFSSLLSAVLLFTSFTAHSATNSQINPCNYPREKAARQEWRPLGNTPEVSITSLEGKSALKLLCPFREGGLERAAWDNTCQLNLGSGQAIEFEFYCADPAPVSYFSIYFQAPGGWYHGMFFPEETGRWVPIRIEKSAFVREGQPSGWEFVTAIRLSAWRGTDQDTVYYVRDLRQVGVLGADAHIAVLRADSLAGSNPEEQRSVSRYTEIITQSLHAAGLKAAVLSDSETNLATALSSARLVALPYNPAMPNHAQKALIEFMTKGGKLIGFYALPEALVRHINIRSGPHSKASHPSQFASISLKSEALPGAPGKVRQKSWNIVRYEPVPGQSRVVAEWHDEQGKPTGPAILASTNAVLTTHVLLGEEPAPTQRLLLAMAGALVPDLWAEAARTAYNSMGAISRFKSFDEASVAIAQLGHDKPRATTALQAAVKLRSQALTELSSQRFIECLETSQAARLRIEEAFCAAQSSRPGEFRGFWCHSAFGVNGLTWDEAIRRLATNGFTAILPNMLWGGATYYRSDSLPLAKDMGDRPDQIAECLAACRKYGIEIHVWKVNWNLGSAVDPQFLSRMRQEGRLQKSLTAKQEPWLCPSHPENQQLEIKSMVELARKYEIDGIHFDYIRYPDAEHCFCSGCKERFSRAAKVNIHDWPKDVTEGGPYRGSWLDWRRDNITTVVRSVSEQARSARPRLKISAAVFPNWNTDRDRIGQDWKLWCESGYLDFVCPMDYTPSSTSFANMVRKQVAWAGAVPCYPGIGESASSSRFGADKVIDQIDIARREKAGGFVIFNYAVPESTELLPKLGMGITAR